MNVAGRMTGPKSPSHVIVSPLLRGSARRLRREMTTAERKFWYAVRGSRLGGFLFRRQTPIAGYIVDFVCHERRLIVEIDGATHSTDMELASDRARTARVQREGYDLIRYWNDDILRNLPMILDQLLDLLQRRPASSPSQS